MLGNTAEKNRKFTVFTFLTFRNKIQTVGIGRYRCLEYKPKNWPKIFCRVGSSEFSPKKKEIINYFESNNLKNQLAKTPLNSFLHIATCKVQKKICMYQTENE